MVRMKLSKEEFDPRKLDIEPPESTFKRYRGEIPTNGTILIFRVTKMWWTQSNAGDSQIRVMAFAEQNKGPLKKYNGLPIREYLTFNPDNAFRYQPFLRNFGLTTRDIFNKMDVEPQPDNIGDIINSIGGWVVGSDDALCRVAVVRDHYNPDELRAKADLDGWMPLEDEDELDDDDDDEDDEDMQEEPEDEEDTPPARPTRGSGKTSRARASAPKSRRRAEPEPEEDDDDDDYDDEEDDDIDDEAEEDDEAIEEDEEEADEEADEEPPARTRRSRTARSSTAAARPAARTPARGRGRTQRTAPADGARRGGRSNATRESTRAKRVKEDDPPF